MSGDAPALDDALAELDERRITARLWQRDPTVWAGDPATPELADRLGWLTLPEQMVPELPALTTFADEVRPAVDRVVLLGMGGSGLAPDVLWRAFGARPGHPSLCLLDSTHPEAVRAVADDGSIDRTLFLVASKSGTTLETMSLFHFFWNRAGERGAQFVAVTDPGTPLEALARERRFRRTVLGPADVGGRYSALSPFGLLPAALVGIEPAALLRRAAAMAMACGATVPAADNPGARLGALLAAGARAGRDKLALGLSSSLSGFGLWAEQLVAESTGKAGQGILPVIEPPSDPGACADDRLFVHLSYATERRGAEEARLAGLEAAGHPVVRLTLDGPPALGAEFYRWEFGTAVAGALLGINPFDQPNVAESKRNTHAALAEADSALPPPASQKVLRRFLEDAEPGHYVAILAYLPPCLQTDARLAQVQARWRDGLGVAVTAGYGPRYLHSTGQLHKGGPPTGHYVQVVDVPARDLPIPGEPYTFGRLLVAQAIGDYRALAERARPVLRVPDLDALEEALQ